MTLVCPALTVTWPLGLRSTLLDMSSQLAIPASVSSMFHNELVYLERLTDSLVSQLILEAPLDFVYVQHLDGVACQGWDRLGLEDCFEFRFVR
jgi:hypothetical protein